MSETKDEGNNPVDDKKTENAGATNEQEAGGKAPNPDEAIKKPLCGIDSEGYFFFRAHLSEGVYRLMGIIHLEVIPYIKRHFDKIKEQIEAKQKSSGVIQGGFNFLLRNKK